MSATSYDGAQKAMLAWYCGRAGAAHTKPCQDQTWHADLMKAPSAERFTLLTARRKAHAAMVRNESAMRAHRTGYRRMFELFCADKSPQHRKVCSDSSVGRMFNGTGKAWPPTRRGSPNLYESDPYVRGLRNLSVLRDLPSDRAFAVEYFAGWCGHCQMFAPVWRSLASLACSAAPALTVAAVDCVADGALCREQRIHSFPTIKLYMAGVDAVDGARVQHCSPHRRRLMAGIAKGRGQRGQRGRAQSGRGRGRFRRAEAGRRLATTTTTTAAAAAAKAGQATCDGSEMLRTLLNRAHPITPAATAGGRSAAAQKGAAQPAPPQQPTKLTVPLVTALRLEAAQVEAASAARGCAKRSADAFAKAQGRSAAAAAAAGGLRRGEEPAEARRWPLPMRDLGSALLYGLREEASRTAVGPAGAPRHAALVAWLSALASPRGGGFPGAANRAALGALAAEAAAAGPQWPATPLQPLISADGADGSNWAACRGWRPTARGYPCGLWLLFHTLLARAPTPRHARQTLAAIRGYVEHFFGCSACATHFGALARGAEAGSGVGAMPVEADSADAPLLWMWRAHNAVNRRLNTTEGDAVLDRSLRKLQWPAREQCPACRDATGEWREVAVASFLRRHYRQDS